MNWFYKWLARRITRAHSDKNLEIEQPSQWSTSSSLSSPKVSSGTHLRSNGMPFTIYNANGGYVIEYHSYDSKRDESTHRIHVIPEGDDANDSLAKIIMLEIIRS